MYICIDYKPQLNFIMIHKLVICSNCQKTCSVWFCIVRRAFKELERMQADVDTMQQYLSKYGESVMTSIFHIREALVFLTEKPEIIQQAIFVDILKRHKGKVNIAVTNTNRFL